jgi:methylthioribose-1-phosphate isomerase
MFSQMFGKDIKLKFTKLAAQGRRTDGFTKPFWGLDAYIDADIAVDGNTIEFRGFSNKEIPNLMLNKKEELKDPAAVVASAVQELMFIGHTIFNITVPAGVAAAMGVMSPEEAAKKARSGAYLTRAIPGSGNKATVVANLAKRIADSFQ